MTARLELNDGRWRLGGKNYHKDKDRGTQRVTHHTEMFVQTAGGTALKSQSVGFSNPIWLLPGRHGGLAGERQVLWAAWFR